VFLFAWSFVENRQTKLVVSLNKPIQTRVQFPPSPQTNIPPLWWDILFFKHKGIESRKRDWRWGGPWENFSRNLSRGNSLRLHKQISRLYGGIFCFLNIRELKAGSATGAEAGLEKNLAKFYW